MYSAGDVKGEGTVDLWRDAWVRSRDRRTQRGIRIENGRRCRDVPFRRVMARKDVIRRQHGSLTTEYVLWLIKDEFRMNIGEDKLFLQTMTAFSRVVHGGGSREKVHGRKKKG